jgi:hypothetical protein
MKGSDEEFDTNENFYNNKNRYVRPLFSYDLIQFKNCGVLDSEREIME